MPNTLKPRVSARRTNERAAAFMPHAGAPMLATARFRFSCNTHKHTLVYADCCAAVW